MNKEETVKLLMLVKSHYLRYFDKVDEPTFKMMVDSWHGFFEDIPIEVMVKAVQLHILSGDDYPPKVKTIREQVVKMMNPTNIPLSPEMAWEIAHKTVTRTYGRYRKGEGMEYLRGKNNAIARAVSAVGWERICDASNEDLAFRKNEFIAYYNETSASEKQDFIVPKQIMNRLNQIKLEQSEKSNGPKQLPEV